MNMDLKLHVEEIELLNTIELVSKKAIGGVNNDGKLPFPIKEYSKSQIMFIRKALCEIPSAEMAVIYLRFWESFSLVEISHFLKLRFDTVEGLLRSGLRRLANAYDEDYEQFILTEVLACA